MIDAQIYRDSYGASYHEVYRHEQQCSVLRFTILDNQVARRARVELWSGSQWNEVYSLVPTEMKTRVVGAAKVDEETFAADRERLLRVALEILS